MTTCMHQNIFIEILTISLNYYYCCCYYNIIGKSSLSLFQAGIYDPASSISDYKYSIVVLILYLSEYLSCYYKSQSPFLLKCMAFQVYYSISCLQTFLVNEQLS